MKITIYRGTKEIGGTLIELKSRKTRILVDAGYPLFLNNNPINKDVAKLPTEELLELGVLPQIKGLYEWDKPSFDAILISHAHLDHYGLLKYVHKSIPVFMSKGTSKIIELSENFKIIDSINVNVNYFTMYDEFYVGDFRIKPYLVDHSAFDSAAFKISCKNKTVIYTGDFRLHGRKSNSMQRFISNATKQPDALLIEGTMLGRENEKVITEIELEDEIVNFIDNRNIPILFQASSQNIDRLVTFYKVALRLKKLFVIDIYTANVLYELNKLGNNIPYPSEQYSNIKVFYPYSITQKIYNELDEKYAKRFSKFHISRESINKNQNNIIMGVRPSQIRDLDRCKLTKGIFIYSMWQGYRESYYQKQFEQYLNSVDFKIECMHTSGHSSITDIKKIIEQIDPKIVIPVHTMEPNKFKDIFNRIAIKKDGKAFEI